MSLGRIYGDASRFSISRPGYDVRFVPRTPDYMAIDSSFAQSLRLLMSGVLFGVAATSSPTVFYGTTYATPPFVELYPYNAGISRIEQQINYQQSGGGSAVFGTNININQQANRFSFNPSIVGPSGGYESVPRDWIYFVYPG
jgi:hypothetical protein